MEEQFVQLSLLGDDVGDLNDDYSKGPIICGCNVYELLSEEVMRGTGVMHGKQRVERYYMETHPSNREFAEFLKEEYGIGGHTGHGEVFCIDHDAKGICIKFRNGESFLHKWKDVAVMISAKIETRCYV